MKSAIISDLMFFNILLMLVICLLDKTMNFEVSLKLISTKTFLLKDIFVVILSLSLGSLEHHFPIIENFIIFILFIKLLWGLAGKDRDEIKILHLFVNYIMESSFVMTWTIPKFNRITLISFEEFHKFSKDCR